MHRRPGARAAAAERRRGWHTRSHGARCLRTAGRRGMYPAPCPGPEHVTRRLLGTKGTARRPARGRGWSQALVVLGALPLRGPCVCVEQACLRPPVRGHPRREFSVVVGGGVQLEAEDPGDVALNGLEGSVGDSTREGKGHTTDRGSAARRLGQTTTSHVPSCWSHGMTRSVLGSPAAIHRRSTQVAAVSRCSRPRHRQPTSRQRHSAALRGPQSSDGPRMTAHVSAVLNHPSSRSCQ